MRRFAADSLWELWFSAGTEEQNERLRDVAREPNQVKARAELDELIREAPAFAEAYNQRGIVHFRLEQFDRSAADCEAALKLNPNHFGAQAGLGQCYLRMRKHRAALRAFKVALRINPRLDGVAEAVRTLENTLGEAE